MTTRTQKVAASVAVAVVAVYIFVTLVTVLPSSPLRSSVVTATAPYFSQKWNVFAPSIMKTNTEFVIEAQWRGDGGELVKSDWVSVTGIEQQSVPGHAMPSRIQKSSWNAMLAYYGRYVALNEQQREVVRDTFIERDGEGGYRAKPPAPLIEQLEAVDGTDAAAQGDIVRFLRYDYMLKEYATDFATAYFGKPIERVRWKLVRTRPNDFDHRFDEQQQFDPYTVTFGWRHVDDVVDPETLAVYDDMLKRYGPTS
ncbi:DUF5819 family protein [Herbiconiux daphne]|uniref:DUF5819 family protein n=1 Tax=Herbiconiux daphne TaxID=2970914 RepID=A0ABT2H3Y5_9MICO|nr:DUF5819 family protein [Herbiconiux daphne]MCS5734621.1 DUF5819 family protein [Herbiconiux daphne]